MIFFNFPFLDGKTYTVPLGDMGLPKGMSGKFMDGISRFAKASAFRSFSRDGSRAHSSGRYFLSAWLWIGLSAALGLFALAFVGMNSPWLGHLYTQWQWGLVFLSFFAAYALAKPISLAAYPLILSCFLSSIQTFHFPHSVYKSFGAFEYFGMTRVSAIALGTLVIALLALGAMKPHIGKILIAYRAFALLCAGYMIFQALVGDPAPARGGFIGNASMGGSLLAMTLPFHGPVGLALVAGAILCTQATVPLLALLAYLVGRLGKWGIYLALPVAAVGAMLQGPEILGSSGRTGVWKEAWDYFAGVKPVWVTTGPVLPEMMQLPPPDPLLGVGLGVTQVLMPRIQVENYAYRDEFFLWLHSDLLQVGFEMGLLGFFGLAIFLVYLLLIVRDSKKRGALFASLVVMAFNFPLHSFPHAMLLGVLVLWFLEGDRKWKRT